MIILATTWSSLLHTTDYGGVGGGRGCAAEMRCHQKAHRTAFLVESGVWVKERSQDDTKVLAWATARVELLFPGNEEDLSGTDLEEGG